MLNPIKILVLTTLLEVDDAQKILKSFLFIFATIFHSKILFLGKNAFYTFWAEKSKNEIHLKILVWMSDHHSGSKIKYFNRLWISNFLLIKTKFWSFWVMLVAKFLLRKISVSFVRKMDFKKWWILKNFRQKYIFGDFWKKISNVPYGCEL